MLLSRSSAWRGSVDNACYAYGVGEKLKMRFEEAGRVALDETEVKAMARTKTVHICLISVFILASVWMVGTNGKLMVASVLLIFVMFAVGGLVEACGPRPPEANVILAAARICGLALCGLIAFSVLMSLAGSTLGAEDS